MAQNTFQKMVSSSLVLKSVRIMVQLSDQEMSTGPIPWTESQTLFELHRLPANVIVLFQVPAQDPTLYFIVMSPYCPLICDTPSLCPVFHDLDTLEEYRSVIS